MGTPTDIIPIANPDTMRPISIMVRFVADACNMTPRIDITAPVCIVLLGDHTEVSRGGP